MIVALLLVALVYLKLTRYRFGPLVLLAAVLVGGLFAVYDPDSTTVVANYLGVERGADLLLYLTVVFQCAALGIIYGKFRSIDERITQLFREITLQRGEEREREGE